MSIQTPYKPSPLSFNSPSRASPFRRPESPASPSPLRNSTTPTTSPTKGMGAGTPSPSKLNQGSTSIPEPESWTPRGLVASISSRPREPTPTPSDREPPASPTRGASSPRPGSGSMLTTSRSHGDSNNLSKLQPAQVRELREGFQILDRDSDGVVGRDDVADMLSQLGLPSDPISTSRFFPSSTPQTLTLPAYLTQISNQLAALSSPNELLSALAAFDDEDSGQIDLAELKDALLRTAPENGEAPLTEREIEKITSPFSGRRAFRKERAMGMGGGMGMGKRGEVFRYQEFVQAVAGGSGNGKEGKEEDD